jgi:2-oxoglutarate ferredoxin oxidoreductase subunit beta
VSVLNELEKASLSPAAGQTSPEKHPMDDFMRMDRMPHIWCPTCGIGVSVNCFAKALEKCEIPLDELAVVSGIGCTGRVAGYVKVDSFHTTHGRAIPFATGLKLANPKLHVVVFSGDGDLVAIGGNHFLNAARRNIDLTVICINNFNYAMTGGQLAPTTPEGSILTTSPFGSYEEPFNLPFLAESAGAVYVARWTSLHIYNQTNAMVEAIKKPGFTFIEILAPCPTIYERQQRYPERGQHQGRRHPAQREGRRRQVRRHRAADLPGGHERPLQRETGRPIQAVRGIKWQEQKSESAGSAARGSS